jgi:ketosteroid isomerase-like protein
MDSKEKPHASGDPGNRAPAAQAANPEMEEFFARFHEQMSQAKSGEAPIATAMQALRELSLGSDAEEAVEQVEIPGAISSILLCSACGASNREGHRFCSTCGAPLEKSPEVATKAGQHFYHHHYHHHYLAPNGTSFMPQETRISPAGTAAKDFTRSRVPTNTTGAQISRAETAVRQISQNWAQACNTKHLDDLMDLYAADALVFRPNVAPIRGTAPLREFFVSVLGSGLGEVELDAVRVELFGNVAYEAGRCKMLVPTVAGKRREERGKYVLLAVRESEGDWKIVVDCWATDLGLDK